MIDLHTHTFFSDGSLIPSELVYRAQKMGYKLIAITDHVDLSNYDFVIPRIKKVCEVLNKEFDIKVVHGAELTYVPPKMISPFALEVRKMGAQIVIVHGETTVESVPQGTNKAALLSKIDILAHPGRIFEEDVELAKKNNICLEITSRAGHCLSNRWIAKVAKKIGAKLIINTDAHDPEDLIGDKEALNIVKNAGLTEEDLKEMFKNAMELVGKRGSNA